MRHLSVFLALFLTSSCALRAQQNIATGVNIYPNAAGSAGGYINMYNAGATAYARIAMLSGSSPMIIPPAGSTSPALILRDINTIGSSNGLALELSNGTRYFSLDSSTSLGPTFTAQNGQTMWFSSTNSGVITDASYNFVSVGAGYLANFFNSGSAGGGVTITSSAMAGFEFAAGWPGTSHWQVQNGTGNLDLSGNLKVWNGTGLAGNSITIHPPSSGLTDWDFTLPPDDGTADYFLKTNGSGVTSWALPTVSDPAWTSYTPTVGCSSGSPSTTTSSAAYIQQGKTVKIRIYWTGTCSSAAQTITFTLPVTPLTGASYQSLGVAYFNVSGTFIDASDVIVSGTGSVFVGSSAGNFPASPTAVFLSLTGIYEAN